MINKNVQSTSFKLLQMALENGGEAPDLSRPEGVGLHPQSLQAVSPVPPRSPATAVRAPRIKESGLSACTTTSSSFDVVGLMLMT